jgi:hypothetical protein
MINRPWPEKSNQKEPRPICHFFSDGMDSLTFSFIFPASCLAFSLIFSRAEPDSFGHNLSLAFSAACLVLKGPPSMVAGVFSFASITLQIPFFVLDNYPAVGGVKRSECCKLESKRQKQSYKMSKFHVPLQYEKYVRFALCNGARKQSDI